VFLLCTAEVLYALNFAFLLPLVVVGLYVVFLPLPEIFRSLLSRSVVGVLIFYAMYQIIAVIQFMLLPASGFTTAAVLLGLSTFLLLLIIGRPKKIERIVIGNHDIGAVLTTLFFVIPVVGYCLAGPGVIERIASIGAIQGNDGATHFSLLSEATHKEKLTYNSGAIYYPYGFHLTTGFIESSYGLKHGSFSWSNSAKLYIAEFILFAVIMAYSTYFMVLGLLGMIKSKPTGLWQGLLIALSLGPALSLFYLLPFLYRGFLNYYYICATLIFGLLILLYEFVGPRLSAKVDGQDKGSYALIGLLLLFGAASSWPLFVPIVLGVALVIAIFPHFKTGLTRRIRPNKLYTLIGLGMLIQLIPLYLQLSYASVGTAEGLNATGGLRIFHPQLLLLTVLLISYIYCSERFSDSFKRATSSIFLPLLTIVVSLAAYQFFSLGEVRYYVIKVSMFAEILLLIFLVALVVDRLDKIRLSWEQAAIVMVLLPITVFFSLLSLNDNPVKDTRDLFRSYSGMPKPAYLDQDVNRVTQIGLEGGLQEFNVVTLHYTDDKTKIFAHPQTAYWANSLTFKGEAEEYAPKDCYYKIYTNLILGTFTPREQEELINQVKLCADIAHENGRRFYIITDQASSSRINDLFGATATIQW
jgi:hypothetical protein